MAEKTGEEGSESSATNSNTAGAGAGAGTPTAEEAAAAAAAAGKGTVVNDAGKGGEAGKLGPDGKPITTPQGAPEKYEPFTIPEGFVADEEANKTFMEEAKAANLTQAQAQKLVDMYGTLVAKHVKGAQDEFEKMKTEWAQETKKMLGANAEKELAMVAKGRDAFFDAEGLEILKDSGLGNHPAIVRAFIKIGKAIADDTVVDGGKGGGGEKSQAEILYPNQGHK